MSLSPSTANTTSSPTRLRQWLPHAQRRKIAKPGQARPYKEDWACINAVSFFSSILADSNWDEYKDIIEAKRETKRIRLQEQMKTEADKAKANMQARRKMADAGLAKYRDKVRAHQRQRSTAHGHRWNQRSWKDGAATLAEVPRRLRIMIPQSRTR